MPRVSVALTETDIKALSRLRGRDLWKAVGGGPKGFCVRQTPAGATKWYYRYKTGGGQRVHPLGDFPSMGLEEARTEALAAHRERRSGADPQRDRKARDAARRAEEAAERTRISTVAEAFESLMQLKSKNRPGSLALDRQVFDTHLRDRLGGMVLTALRPQDVLRLKVSAEAIAVKQSTDSKGRRFLRRTGGPSAAGRAVDMLRQILRHANSIHGFNLPDVTAEVRKRCGKAQERERHLEAEELRKIWYACEDPGNAPCDLSPTMALAIQLCMLTLQRCGEVVGVTDAELKSEVWRLPARRSKNGKAHEVPLSAPARRVILVARRLRDIQAGEKVESGPIFPRPGNLGVSLDRHSISRAMNRLSRALGLEDVRTHDLRRTGVGIMIWRLGIMPLVVSRVVNHAADTGGAADVTMKHYAGSISATQKREALNRWADHLMAIIQTENSEQTNVVTVGGHL